MSVYNIGNKVTMRATFKDENGALADPDSVVLKLKTPVGVESTVAPTKDATGLYHYDKVVDASGVWHYRWVGVGTVDAAGEAFFTVKKSAFDDP